METVLLTNDTKLKDYVAINILRLDKTQYFKLPTKFLAKRVSKSAMQHYKSRIYSTIEYAYLARGVWGRPALISLC